MTLFFALLLASAGARAQNDAATAPFSAAAYRVGERLTYNVAFSNFPTAAHVQLQVMGRGQYFGREGVELRAHVETIGVVNAALYALNNNYLTYVDASNGLPYRAQQVIREGGRTASDTTSDFNTPAGTSALPPRQLSGGLTGFYDFLSALYRARSLPLAPGATYAFPVQHGPNLYQAELKVTGREMVKTNVGSSNAIVTQVRVRGNSAADKHRVHIYFSDDERHVPLIITVKLKSGEIRAELASAEIVVEPAPALAGAGPNSTAAPPVTTPRDTSPVPGATAPTAAAAAPALPFEPGEQLNFNFYLGTNPQPVGTGSFQVRARSNYFNRDGLLLTSVLQTTGAGRALFPVNDQINSYVDAATLLPFRTELNLNEGERRRNFLVSLDQNGGAALFADGTRVEIPVGTHDLLSVFYALRSYDLTPPKRTTVSLLVNQRPRLLFVTALRRGDIALGGQTIPAVELALATNDPEGDRFNLRLWVSADKRRLPLRLTATTPLGLVRADLAIIPTALH